MKLVFFSFSLLISCFCLRLNYRKKALAFENIHNLAEIFPEILKDENQDGFSDKYDFINIISANQSSTPPYLNKIDIIGIFLQVDINKDGLISKREWKQFYKNFVLEFFEKCDQNKDYLLNQNELKECLNEESNQLLKKGIFDFHKLIKFMMFEGKIDQINFLEYLKAKNFMKSWIYCSKNSSHINSKQFLCSINISHMELDVEKSQIASLFLTGRKLSRQSLKKELPNETLNFYIFFNLNMKFHCFSKNQKFMGKLSLNKKEFFDTTFRSYEFPIDFQGFFLMKEIEDLINIYGKTKVGFINLNEFTDLFVEEFIDEVQKLIKSCNYESKDIKIHLTTFFEIFDSDENHYFSALEIYEFYKFAFAFMEVDKDLNFFFSPKNLIPFRNKNLTFLINFQENEINKMLQLIDANKSLQIDFIMFSSFMRYEYLLSNYTEPKSSSITKENLIRLLPKLGMKFQENTLEEAEITENLYDYEIAYKLSFINYGINLNKTLNQNQT